MKISAATILSLTGLLIASSASAVYFEYTVDGDKDKYGLSVSGTIDFGNPGQAIIELTNNTGGMSSQVTGVYFLKPTDAVQATNLTAYDSLRDPFGDIDGEVMENWANTNVFKKGADGPYDLPEGNYLGAFNTKNSNKNLGTGQDVTFVWDLKGYDNPFAVDWDAYYESEVPQVLIRWQSVGPDQKWSDRGYAFVSLTDVTPVPEPKAIALMAVAGMGGLLVIRRRLKSRKNT